MERGQELFEKVVNGALGKCPFRKGTLYFIVNAYLTSYKKNYLDVNTNFDLLDYCNDVNKFYSKEDLDEISALFDTFSKQDLIDLVTFTLFTELNAFRDYCEFTSNSLLSILNFLLDVDGQGHIVADYGCGNGRVLADILLKAQSKGIVLKDLIGYEINNDQAKMSQMALDILSNGRVRPIIKNCDVLEEKNIRFSRGYCFPPLGLKQIVREKGRQSKLFKSVEFTNRNTGDWLFVDNLLSGLEKNGRAVAVVCGRALFNYADESYRKKLIESGLLEGIIELPNGSLNFTNIKPYMLVFSYGNKKVKLVDASGAVDTKSKRSNKVEISAETVISLYNSVDVPNIDIDTLKDISNIVPSSVLLPVDKPKNGVPLGDIAEVFTGNQYTLGVFEKSGMLTKEATGYRILTSSDIEDGCVDWKMLNRIKYEDDKFDKYAVKKNDVIVTSKSSKVKTVVVDIEPKEKILVTGGMIIVRPNINMVDPTYLKIFLDSEQGQNALKSIQKGMTIVMINSKELATVLIPLIDINKQLDIARKYNDKLSTLYALKQEVKKIEESLSTFYLDVREEE